MRALVVDADPRASWAINLMLKANHIVADRVGLAKDAFELARRQRYDILLVDLIMPDMSGRRLVQAIRRAGFSCPMLVLSDVDQSHARTVALEAGADGYVHKPFHRAELLGRIRALLSHDEKSRQQAPLQATN